MKIGNAAAVDYIHSMRENPIKNENLLILIKISYEVDSFHFIVSSKIFCNIESKLNEQKMVNDAVQDLKL